MSRKKITIVFVLVLVTLIATTAPAAAQDPEQLGELSEAVGRVTSHPAAQNLAQGAQQVGRWANATYNGLPTTAQAAQAIQDWRWGQAAVPYINRAADTLAVR